MWLSGIKYSDGIFKGTLDNTPYYLKNIALGDVVEAKVDDVSDWMIIDGSNHVTGGYTVQVLLDDMSEEDRNEFLSSTGYILNDYHSISIDSIR